MLMQSWSSPLHRTICRYLNCLAIAANFRRAGSGHVSELQLQRLILNALICLGSLLLCFRYSND